MIKEKKYYTVQCDCCGKKLKRNGVDVLMLNSAKVNSTLPAKGWTVGESGNEHFCKSCKDIINDGNN